jgi:tetratricopeptide (TPR) repeat protein
MAADIDPELDPATERQVAAALFNRVWWLLDATSRSQEQEDELVHAVHASAYHWLRIGTAQNRARGEWQCSHVYAVVGRPEPALHHARRCLAICEANGIGNFDLGFAYEALARAHAIAGDHDEAMRWVAAARDAADDVAEDEDRELLLSDLATIPGVTP